MIIKSDFRPAWWLTNPHAQTLYPTFARRLSAPIDRFEQLELPDGDFIELGWAENGLPADAPLVVLLHGLGGNFQSVYVGRLFRSFNRAGYRGVLLHFRGSGAPNRLARAYHSGDTADLDVVLNHLAKREPNTAKAVVGISLGGNVLLKWLGEKGKQSLIRAAVAVSVPFQLHNVADQMNRGFSRIYQAHLLRKLRKLFTNKINALGDECPYSVQELEKLRCFWTFDDQITAPLHGFANVHEYYREASSRPYLTNIATSTLIIHALDDPFMTPQIIPSRDELSAEVVLELSKHGGHVGFITGQIPGKPIYWLAQRIPEYLRAYLLN